MDMIEVDPKLFVTCRLCLEDLGQYQIVPSVKQQIKYCFDIDVEPFDGLPQLICMKCSDILNKFHTAKITFNEKQVNLISKVLKRDEICIQPQQDTVSSSQQVSENTEDSKKKKSKRKRVLQSSSSDFESEQSYHVSKRKKKTSRHNVKQMPWEADYKKQFACKICNSLWLTKTSIWNHMRSHDLLKTRYENIFNRQSIVKLNRIDEKPNVTGVSDMVVYSSNKIIAPGNSYFYIVYSKLGGNVAGTNHLDSSEPVENNVECFKESTDDEQEIVLKASKRKRRLLSRSSSETVVIASNSNKILSEEEFEEDSKITVHDNIIEHLRNDQCINIDDSSDSESGQGTSESSQRAKPPMEAKLCDYKIIQGIISMCVNTYHKKNESTDEMDMLYINVNDNKKKDTDQLNSESQLKHKVLSIGRKIINKQGFNCTGLLRYMEQKNLEIVWLSKSLSYSNNYIRILTKLRGRESIDQNFGWVNISCKPDCKSLDKVNNLPEKAVSSQSLSTVTVSNQSVYDATPVTTSPADIQIETNQLEQINKPIKSIETMPAMLYLENKASSSDMKKLLNANPVANPKQLPKKVVPGNEPRSNKTSTHPSTSHEDTDDVNYCLPVITSTTSLAPQPNKEQDQDGKNKNNFSTANKTTNASITETPAPRIKVKPASELMSERHLNNFLIDQAASVPNNNILVNAIENTIQWPQNTMNVFATNIAPQLHVASPPLQIVQMCPSLNIASSYQVMPAPASTNVKPDHVILHTTEFPNTKTVSPFKYLKDLLQVHNLVLLDPCETLSREFICLIKFKVQFKQEPNRDPPVFLCLSIFCSRNIFCLKVRDRNQENIDINRISANWQWEILRIYRGDVVVKVLQNAKKISQATFNWTNNFFCLLKSIECLQR